MAGEKGRGISQEAWGKFEVSLSMIEGCLTLGRKTRLVFIPNVFQKQGIEFRGLCFEFCGEDNVLSGYITPVIFWTNVALHKSKLCWFKFMHV